MCMARDLDRRRFLQGSLLGSAALASGLSLEERALLGATRETSVQRAASGIQGLPAGKIGDVTISRLICGGNLIGGYAHSRDLVYVSPLLKHYFTDQKIFETLELCEESGVNTIITGTNSIGVLRKYWDERGGKIQWLAQCGARPDDLETDVKRAVDAGATGAFLIGNIGDEWSRAGQGRSDRQVPRHRPGRRRDYRRRRAQPWHAVLCEEQKLPAEWSSAKWEIRPIFFKEIVILRFP
jgi:hypothetical protein